MPLADILGQGGEWQPARLLDIYVPLQVDFSLTLQVAGGKIADWWARDEEVERTDEQAALIERAETVAGGETDEARKLLRRRTWPRLGAGEAELQRIVDEIGRKIERRQNEAKEKETKDKQAQEKDGSKPWYMEAHDAASVQGRFVLLGEPGSGKSSFLRHLALCLAGELRLRAGDKDAPANASHAALREWLLSTPLTPIYVEMRELVKEDFPPLPPDKEAPPGLPNAETFWRYLGKVAGPRLAEPGGELRQLCDEGRAILLLDGLDEVQQADDERRRRQVQALVKSLGDLYPKLRIIIAARTQPYERGGWSLAGFGVAKLRPLSLGRLHELAHALFRRLRGETDGAAQADAFMAAVRRQLNDGRIERSFYANPLFFTLLAGLWLDPRAGGRLPETRAALYRRSVELLLWRWTRRRLPSPSVAEQLGLDHYDELRSVLETLACTVHEQSAPGQDTTEFGRKEVLDVLDEAHRSAQIGDITDYLGQHTGLLTAPAPRKLYFIHRSFQEHLAACELICPEPEKHLPPVAPDRCFPHGLARRVLARPELWENVARLAADELAAKGRNQELGKLLAALCVPYLDGQAGTAAQAALLALDIAREGGLFEAAPGTLTIIPGDFETLRRTAIKAVEDWQGIPLPEQRNRAGEALGLRRDLDTRRGVGLRRDGLPDIQWEEVPETDAQGRSEFTYREGKRPSEPTFWMARYPITYVQFQAFVEAEDGYHDARRWDGLAAWEDERRKVREQRFPFWNHPRDNVTWYAAVAFCRWLSFQAEEQRGLLPPPLRRRNDWRIRLPTEWQWEKAARGHDGRRYPWGGGEYRSGFANIDETNQLGDNKPVGPHFLQKTNAVGMYPHSASPYGILDLSGNVSEWCLKRHENPDNYLKTGWETRVVRGGSWFGSGDDAAATVRIGSLPDHGNDFEGFRAVACVVPVA